MKTEGWFLRVDTGEYVPIMEHRLHIQEPENARRLGVPERVISEYPKWQGRDRIAFLTWLLKMCPNLVRVRNHGPYIAFESYRVTPKTMVAIQHMCQSLGFGDLLLVVVNELRPRGRCYREFWMIFDERIRKGIWMRPVERKTR